MVRDGCGVGVDGRCIPEWPAWVCGVRVDRGGVFSNIQTYFSRGGTTPVMMRIDTGSNRLQLDAVVRVLNPLRIYKR